MDEFVLDLNDLFECNDLFYFLERKSDGGRSYECQINADSPETATEELFKRLKPFLISKFYKRDSMEEEQE